MSRARKVFTMAVFTLVMWVIGLIGNSIGLYAAWKDKSKCIRVILLKAFYAINLVNLLFMFFYPLLESFGEYYLWNWNGYAWKHYLATLHFPLAKTFLNLSFSICLIFATSKMVAILYPFYYREYFTNRRIKLVILGSFIYLLIWFIPSAWWYQVIEITNICDMEPDFLLYLRNLVPLKTSRERNSWIIYGLLREFMTKYLPVIAIYIFNILFLKRKKNFLRRKSEQHKLLNLATPDLLLRDRKKVESTTSCSLNFQPDFINISNDMRLKRKSSKIFHLDSSTSPTNVINIQEFKMERKWKEYNINKRMLLINTLEFIIFLFPVSLYMIVIDFVDSHSISDRHELVLIVCTLVEYMFVTLTFYSNFLFNPGYREEITKLIRKSFTPPKTYPFI
ncbi:unnamed protein product [Gordionus sp. m RMFG-2023]